ncbi:hypothetical protein GXW74_23460 [Roseomonas eburnea]|uniref:Membrane protein 6-pyruvoyl-tetrahydropterin synthase-related domain-containing protein n=1 Tax=Neoroseomonas eburnea TaxID=1346889 RepID=A0A9X9XIC8_9PROT|nr:hypothetical protein [Neoroseomonas eburnea]MBR0683464.1 hypothetical protein [Neoroseomonas eburnea]
MREEPVKTRSAWPASALAVALAALFLVWPLLLFGAPPSHSAIYNATWASQFIELLNSGVVYPRWLPGSFGGFGSSAFFFYAPVPFYWAWLHTPLAEGAAGTFRVLGAAMATMLLASGLSMRAWLGRHAGPRAATAGAIIYMAMPYHLLDLYLRGSVGEVAAYAVLPLVAMAVSDLARAGARAVVPLAFAAALLMCSHLPTALAAAVFLFPAQFLFEASRRDPGLAALARAAALAAGAGILALGLAAAYLLPALTLQGQAAFDVMQEAFYDPRNSLLYAPGRWRNEVMLVFVGSLCAAVGFAAIVVWRKAPAGPGGSAIRFWAGMAGFVTLAAGGLIPGLWEPWSPLFRIQFPWRLLLLAEFAIVTAVVLSGAAPWRQRSSVLAAVLCLLLGAAAVVVLGAGAWARLHHIETAEWHALRAAAIEERPDALEYLPAGHHFRYGSDGGYALRDFRAMSAALAARGPAWSDPPGAAEVTVIPGQAGELDLAVSAAGEAWIVLRRFHFPTWRLETADGAAGPALGAYGPHRLLAFRVAAGEHRLRLRWAPPPAVRLGEWLSLLSIALALVLMAVQRRAGRGAGTPCPRSGIA